MTKIVFTSCTRYEAFQLQAEWEAISQENPDYLFLLGDNIYMDYGIGPFSKEPIKSPRKYPPAKFKKLMEQKYLNQFTKVTSFRRLVNKMREKNGFYAIWDDHDFAWDNAKGSKVSEEKKEISRSLFHKYVNCSTNLPHVYYHVDLPNARAIFIDNRTDAEPKGKYCKLISDAQFAFIEEKLNHNLDYTLLCGGLTLSSGSENWKKYPSQLHRLCELLRSKKNVIFLGGDIHRNQFVEAKKKKIKGFEINMPVQLISSGMQINFFGLGIPQDDQHNWAILELGEKDVKVTFHNKYGPQEKKSKLANEWFQKHFWK